jgi:hypothetical protein
LFVRQFGQASVRQFGQAQGLPLRETVFVGATLVVAPYISGGIELLEFGKQLVLRFCVLRVFEDAVDGADLDTLRVIEVADAFGAFCGVDYVDFVAL